ncbi:T9SS type A sorting domain-containing protein [Pollutibacter soli]|uniref:T9SS type A sorting domain-containing protein n=1 Tax=Pollutibacter soli TaxID=3034157 RepID=UPI003013DDDA
MRGIIFTLLLLITIDLAAQKKWDGEGNDGQWSTGSNWSPDGVPATSDDVVLDHSFIQSDYLVVLPAGNITVSVNTLHIVAGGGNPVRLELPTANTIAPGLVITGDGNALDIGAGGVLINSSGASSGDAIRVDHGFRIQNEGRYIHHTSRGNASLINQLVSNEGTESGIFEFDVPGAAGYTVSLTGNTFGSLVFSAGNGSKSYNGNGVSTLHIRGNFIVNNGATITSSLTADIIVDKNLEVNGTLQLHPTSSGSNNRSLVLTGNPTVVSGAGNIFMNNNFRKFTLAPNTHCILRRSLSLGNANNTFQMQNGAVMTMQSNFMGGNGSFEMTDAARLELDAPTGIQQSGNEANIRTANVIISPGAEIYFTGSASQNTGTNFPSTIQNLKVDNTGGNLRLSKSLTVTGTLILNSGIVYSTSSAKMILQNASIASPQNQYGKQNQGWEQSYVDGPVQWISDGTGEFTAPVGKSYMFAPVSFTKTQNGFSAKTVEYFPSTCPTLLPVNTLGLHHISAQEYWMIEDHGSASKSMFLSLSWRANSKVAENADDRKALRVAYFGDTGSGNQWNSAGTDADINGNDQFGMITANNSADNFSYLTIGTATALNSLPLQRIVLSPKVEKSGIELSWEVDQPREVKEFIVERSETGNRFKKIHHIQLLADTSSKTFSFTDRTPVSGDNFYRIGIKSADDHLTYSAVTNVKFMVPTQIKLFPNPAREEIFIFFPTLSSKTICNIVRGNGSVVRKGIVITSQTERIQLSDLSPGQYYLTVSHNNQLIVQSFIKY